MPADPKIFASYLLRTRRQLLAEFKSALSETRTPQSVAYNAFAAWFVNHEPAARRELLAEMITCLDPADREAVGLEKGPPAEDAAKPGAGRMEGKSKAAGHRARVPIVRRKADAAPHPKR